MVGTGLGRVAGSSLGGKRRLCPGGFPWEAPCTHSLVSLTRRISRWTRTGKREKGTKHPMKDAGKAGSHSF